MTGEEIYNLTVKQAEDAYKVSADKVKDLILTLGTMVSLESPNYRNLTIKTGRCA
jgi:hypothetical protein